MRNVAVLKIDSRARSTRQYAQMKTPRFLLRGFKRPRDIAFQALGKLEREVLNETWHRDQVSVRDVYLAFDKNVAYTTLMTTLDRLYKKGLLSRRKEGRAFIYSAAVSSEDLEMGIKEDLIDGLLGRETHGVEPVLACIVDAISERDAELLEELDRLIKEKRELLEQKDR
jgi:predicted transcriptional regulator